MERRFDGALFAFCSVKLVEILVYDHDVSTSSVTELLATIKQLRSFSSY